MIREFLQRLLQRPDDARRPSLGSDCVWISAAAKLAGIRAELDKLPGQGVSIVALVAHFPDVLRALEEIAAEYRGPSSVRAVLARQLSAEAGARLPLGPDAKLALVVAERHPLAEEDANLVRFAEALPCDARILYHVSLDDPLLQWFGGESIRALLRQLGAAAHEPIHHPLIAKSIKRAQEKISAEAHGRDDADSAAQWLERNLRR